MKLVIIGAGAVGTNLANLATNAGIVVTIGMRTPQPSANGHKVATIEAAVAGASLVLLAIPFLACAELLPTFEKALKGKIVVDATNPLNPDWSPAILASGTSGAEEIAALLPDSMVVKAFNTIFADIMVADRQKRASGTATAFIASDNILAKTSVMELAETIGFAPLDVGPLAQARYLEAMAHLNIGIAIGQQGGTNAAFIYDQVLPDTVAK
jgi:8-hydroxy-5-deazaflavin:NADPH oxidoreductase